MPSKKFMKKIMIMRNLRDDSGIKSTWCASLNTGVYIPTSKLKTGVFLCTSPPSKYDRGENRSITGASIVDTSVVGSMRSRFSWTACQNYQGGEWLRRTPAYLEGIHKHVCTLSNTRTHTNLHMHPYTSSHRKMKQTIMLA